MKELVVIVGGSLFLFGRFGARMTLRLALIGAVLLFAVAGCKTTRELDPYANLRVQRGGMNLDGIHEACVIISTTVPPTLESCDK